MLISIDQDKCEVVYRNNQVVVNNQDGLVSRIPISKLKSVHIHKHCTLTSNVIAQLLNHDVEVLLCTSRSPKLISDNNGQPQLISLKQACYRISLDETLCLRFAHRALYSKWRTQRLALETLKTITKVSNFDIENVIAKLAKSKRIQTDTHSKLLGTEGAMAREYFQAYRHFFTRLVQFHKASKATT